MDIPKKKHLGEETTTFTEAYPGQPTLASESLLSTSEAVNAQESERIPARSIGKPRDIRAEALERHKAQRDATLEIMNNARVLRQQPQRQPTYAEELRAWLD